MENRKSVILWRIYGVFTLVVSLVLTYLKVQDYINWSWWWVWLPVWGNFAVVILILIVAFATVKHWSKYEK